MIQPDDETPIPADMLGGVPDDVIGLLRSAEHGLAAGADEFSTAVGRELAAVGDGIGSGLAAVDAEVTDLMDTIRGATDSHMRAVAGEVSKLDDRIIAGLNKGEDALIRQGIPYPIGRVERDAILSDTTGEALLGLIPGSGVSPPHLAVDPARCVPGDPDCVRPVDLAPVAPLPIDTPPAAPVPTPPAVPPPPAPCTYDPATGLWTRPTWVAGWVDVSVIPGVVIYGPGLVPGPPEPCEPPVVPPAPPPAPVPIPAPVPLPGPGPGGVVCCPSPPVTQVCPPPVVQVTACPPAGLPPYWPPGVPYPGGTIPGSPPAVPPVPPPPPSSPPAVPPPGVPGDGEPDGEPPPVPPAPAPGGDDKPTIKHIYWDHCETVCGTAEEVRTQPPTIEQAMGDAPIIGRLVRETLIPDALQQTGFTINVLSRLGIAGIAESLTHVPYTYLMQWERYDLQYFNPVYLPDQSGVDAMYLRDYISFDTWNCLTKANGNMPCWWVNTLNSQQSMPSIADVTELYFRNTEMDKKTLKKRLRGLGVLNEDHAEEWLRLREATLTSHDVVQANMRGLWDNADDFNKQMRRVGVTDPKTVRVMRGLAEQIPGYADLLRFMVRDSADDAVAQSQGYDIGFSDKYGPKIKEWAEKQGISEDVFKYYWRAHWEIPSYTQLTEMMHRLRPDRPNPDNIVTPGDVREALEINDMAPSWIASMMEVSYRPITNSDAVRAYQVGYYTSDSLYHAFRDNGYDDTNAKLLTGFHSTVRARMIANSTGVMTMRKIIAAYRDGSVMREDADRLMAPTMPDESVRTGLLDRADEEIQIEIRRCNIKRIKKRYMYGYYDRISLIATLAPWIRHRDRILSTIDQWECERESRMKEPRVAQLCKWYVQGMITGDEYLRRLVNLGYEPEDAYRMVGVCFNDEMLKRLKERERVVKQNIAEYRRMSKEEKENLKEQIATAEKRLKELKKAIEEQGKREQDLTPAPSQNGHG